MTTSHLPPAVPEAIYPVTIEGPRLRLREFREDDLDASMLIAGDPSVTKTLSFDTRSREQQAASLTADIARAKSSPRPDYYLAIEERGGGGMIGFCRLGLARAGTSEIGCAIRMDSWRHGFATEASAMMLRFGYETLGMHRIQAACGPDNLGSQRILARLGFRPEGRMRDHLFTDGAWRDSLLYSLLRNEWEMTLVDQEDMDFAVRTGA